MVASRTQLPADGILPCVKHSEGVERYRNHLKARRLSRGFSQAELAERVGLTRQAIYMIERDRYLPNATTALRIARTLGCRVEDLFTLENAPETVEVELLGDTATALTSDRVKLWRVGERHWGLPLRDLGEPWSELSADALVVSRGEEDDSPRKATVETLQNPQAFGTQIAIAGCDPALSVIADRLVRSPDSLPVVVWAMGSTDALVSLARGHVHLAGVHLRDPSGEFNVPFLREHLGEREPMVVTLAFWEVGLIVARGNPKRLRSVADLARPNVRVVNREKGSGARLLLDQKLVAEGVPARQLRGYRMELRSHAKVARRVSEGLADAAIAPLAVARYFGLDFVPLQSERYDLVIPTELVDASPGIARLLDAIVSLPVRRELEALGGYDTTHTGEIVSNEVESKAR